VASSRQPAASRATAALRPVVAILDAEPV